MPNHETPGADDFQINGDGQRLTGGPVDLTAQLAEYYMQQAAARPAPPTAQREVGPGRWPMVSGIYAFPWYLSTLAVWVYLVLSVTISALLVAYCYHMLNIMFTLGRILALPVGMLAMISMSYCSTIYLFVIERTAGGYDAIDDWPTDGWREWFWTLPTTLGMVGVAGFVGWVFGKLLTPSPWLSVLVATLLLHPILQLSTLETARLTQPVSGAILRSLATHTKAWVVLYIQMILWAFAFSGLAYVTFVDPPYVTLLILAPIAATLILCYARLLGRLAWCFGPASNLRRQ